jgi:hypothetical protein
MSRRQPTLFKETLPKLLTVIANITLRGEQQWASALEGGKI